MSSTTRLLSVSVVLVCGMLSLGGCPFPYIEIPPFNQSPLAYAGPDRNVVVGDRVTLDGLGSHDPDGDALSYRWAQNMGLAVSLENADSPRPSFVPTEPDVYEFTLTVSDSAGMTDDDVVRVSVRDLDDASRPTADAGADRTVAAGSTVRLDGTGSSDPAGRPLSYRWWQTGGEARVILEGENTARPRFTAPDFDTVLTFTLLVSNGELDDTDSVEISVSTDFEEINHPPMAQDQTVRTGKNVPVAITLIANDPDEDPLTYSIVTRPAHGIVTGSAPNVTYTPETDYVGSDSFTFKANDGHDDSNEAAVSISVEQENHAPVAEDQNAATWKNTAVAIMLTATDMDQDTLTYSIVRYPNRGTLTGTPPDVTYTPETDYTGSDSFTFKVNDGQADSNDATVSITIAEHEGGGDPMQSGETVSGCINVPGDQDARTFTVTTPGARVRIVAVETSGDWDRELFLYPPGGGDYVDHGDTIDHQVSSTGQYTIIVQDGWWPGDGIGCYNLTLLNLSDTLTSDSDPDGGPISSGDLVSGQINVPADMDAFTFWGAAGQRVRIIAAETSGDWHAYMYLYPPGGGRYVASGSTIDCQITATGQYTIVVQDSGGDDTGGYNLTLEQF